MGLLLLAVRRAASLLRQAVLPLPYPGVIRHVRRSIVLIPTIVLILLLQLVHWLGFALDEILFPGYRKVPIRRPVFVLGVPRSGTTFMHRLLAHHDSLTTFSAWECFLAPSISERYFWAGLVSLDGWLGRPVSRIVGWVGKRCFRWLQRVHPMSLAAPEEDYLALMPILACFVLVIPFPESQWLWQMGQFDKCATAKQRRRLFAVYRRCLQKHVYFHGADKVLLSKNASFAGMANSLCREFPDARLVVCERDALAVIRSQFAAIETGRRLFATGEDNLQFNSKLLDCLSFYYENLNHLVDAYPAERVHRIALWQLSESPRVVVGRIAADFGLVKSDALEEELSNYEETRVTPRTKETSEEDLTRWGFDLATLVHRFSAWRHVAEQRI